MASLALWTAFALLVVASGLKINKANNFFPDFLKLSGTTRQQCGCTPNKVPRIVGGKETAVNAYPWLVALVTNTGHQFCGGSIICDKWVLTAAHCLQGSSARQILVFANGHNLYKQEEPTPVIIKVRRIIMNSYNNVTNEDDIALLELASPFTFSKGIQPICLPYLSDDFAGAMGIGNGWGYIKEGGPQSEMPREVKLRIMSESECENYYDRYGINIYPEMMCAGYDEGRMDTCQGDSGGPLIVKCESNKYVQCGVVSWGIGCARPKTPGVYTRTADYAYWIYSVTGGCPCFTDCSVQKPIIS